MGDSHVTEEDAKENIDSDLAERFIRLRRPEKADSMFKKIPFNLLVSHPNNTYDVRDIEELADNIKAFGLMDPIIVKPIEGGQYLIIGGHRRHAAIKHLVSDRGQSQFKDVPCHTCTAKESLTIERLRLHSTNFTARDITEYDKLVQIADLMEIIQKAKDNGEYGFQGKMRDIIANYIHLTEKQIQKYITISKFATEDIKQKLKVQSITFEEAYNECKEANRTRTDEKKPVQKGGSVKLNIGARHGLYKQIEDDLTNVLGAKVTVIGDKKGSISIGYNSQQDLDRLFLILRNTSAGYSALSSNEPRMGFII